ncbi:MAG: hypothetical protein QM638_09890 [Nocardioides sp.]|uniref:hypothetical protein n=1 Tax=Nocardioides sp. TaxID=35761 RepID=UPI0039E57AC9
MGSGELRWSERHDPPSRRLGCWARIRLEGLAEYQRAGGSLDVVPALAGGEEYRLSRRLMRRASTGEVVEDAWLAENTHPGLAYLTMETDGRPGRWNTLRALRCLRWYADGWARPVRTARSRTALAKR